MAAGCFTAMARTAGDWWRKCSRAHHPHAGVLAASGAVRCPDGVLMAGERSNAQQVRGLLCQCCSTPIGAANEQGIDQVHLHLAAAQGRGRPKPLSPLPLPPLPTDDGAQFVITLGGIRAGLMEIRLWPVDLRQESQVYWPHSSWDRSKEQPQHLWSWPARQHQRRRARQRGPRQWWCRGRRGKERRGLLTQPLASGQVQLASAATGYVLLAPLPSCPKLKAAGDRRAPSTMSSRTKLRCHPAP
jgi:hypothetical protein